MIKVLTWFKRRPGLTPAEFRHYWRHEHPRAVQAMPGLRAYNQNHTTDAGFDGREPFCDGVAETWWDDLATLHAHRGTGELDALMEDETHFIDDANRHNLVVEERVVLDGTPGPGSVKQFTWLTRRPDLSHEQCHAYWWDHHGPLAASVPGMVRYVQNHAAGHQYRDNRQPVHDGVAVVDLASLDDARRAGASPELAATRADEANFLDTTALPWVLTTQITILEDGR